MMAKALDAKAAADEDAAEIPEEGRLLKRRRATRARLLEAAYKVMSEVGVDGAKIKDITDHADVGFGTFYNYFPTKDDLAAAVLDCVIDDYGRRNVVATRELRRTDPALALPVSSRLVIREAVGTRMWHWWALRPDLLVDRMREGFGPFAKRDIMDAIERGIFTIAPDKVDSAWALIVWMMVGVIHDMIIGKSPVDGDLFAVEAIVRLVGIDPKAAHHVASTPLPGFGASRINWSFELALPGEG